MRSADKHIHSEISGCVAARLGDAARRTNALTRSPTDSREQMMPTFWFDRQPRVSVLDRSVAIHADPSVDPLARVLKKEREGASWNHKGQLVSLSRDIAKGTQVRVEGQET